MTKAQIASAVAALHTGECKWIGREDVHVYCRRPFVERMMPTGRVGWQPGPATYSVVCPDAGLAPGEWVGAVEAVRLVEGAIR